jgi:hypothetical protein
VNQKELVTQVVAVGKSVPEDKTAPAASVEGAVSVLFFRPVVSAAEYQASGPQGEAWCPNPDHLAAN